MLVLFSITPLGVGEHLSEEVPKPSGSSTSPGSPTN